MKKNIPHMGFSLPEMMIALSMLAILTTLIFSLWNTFNRVNYSQMLMEDLKGQTERAMRIMDRNLIRAKRFFARGTAYENLIPWGEIPAPVTWSKDPKVSPTGVFNPESSDFDPDIFGNKLFFAKVENSASFSAGGKNYDINLYRFQMFYLTRDTLHPSRPYGYSLSLVKWESNLFANYWDIEHIWSDTAAHALSQIKNKLKNDFGVVYCWNASEPDPSKAFFRIGSFSPASITFTTTHVMFLVKPITQNMGISFNHSDEYPVPIDVPSFASKSGEFPAGFEVSVIGSASSRKVFIRLVTAGWTRKRVIAYESMTNVSAPEY